MISPQIAGSYRDSYFSMDGFRIAEIGCRSISPGCLPSWFPFGCRCRLVSQICLMISLLAAAASLSPKLISLPDFALGCRCRLVSQASLPSWFRSWLPLPPCLPSLSPFMISLLAAAAACLPSHDFALGCRCRRGSQACLCSWFRSWLPLPPCHFLACLWRGCCYKMI